MTMSVTEKTYQTFPGVDTGVVTSTDGAPVLVRIDVVGEKIGLRAGETNLYVFVRDVPTIIAHLQAAYDEAVAKGAAA